MKITDIKIGYISVPLTTPFKTALRTVKSVNDVIVEVHTDIGNIGYGEAAPTGVITGDTTGAIVGAIEDHIKKALIGLDIEDLETIMTKLDNCVIKNYSAKAAVALARKYNVQLPIIEQVNAVLFDGKEPSEALKDLMNRDRKNEY